MTITTMRDAIRGVADATQEANPNKVGVKAAIEIIGSGDLDLMKQAIVEMAPSYAHQVLATNSRTLGALEKAIANDEQERSAVARRPVSARAMHRPDRRHRVYDARVRGTDGEWKMIGDCTRADLLDAAAVRRAMAAQNLRAAERWEALAALMPDDETQVADVVAPDEVLRVLRPTNEEEA